MSPAAPPVSVIVPVLDEAAFFDSAIGSVLGQVYDGEIEFVFVDGGSTDGTRELLEELTVQRPDVRVIDNPKPGIPVSLNIGLHAAENEIFVRMDAHSEYGSDYVARGVEALVSGRADWAAGPAIAQGDGDWSRWVARALGSRLGVGGADFRLSGDEVYTDAAFGGVVRRKDLLRLRGWDETWVVNEDGELAARAAREGMRILLVPAMAARYIPRDSVEGLVRQYARYGLWRAKTSVAHPESTRPSHVLPPGLAITAAIAITGLAPRSLKRLARLAAVAYLAGVVAESHRVAEGDPAGTSRLVTIFPAMHLSWGAANIVGFVRFGSPLPALRAIVRQVMTRLGG
jgi:GT2 family glycosyltransferase